VRRRPAPLANSHCGRMPLTAMAGRNLFRCARPALVRPPRVVSPAWRRRESAGDVLAGVCSSARSQELCKRRSSATSIWPLSVDRKLSRDKAVLRRHGRPPWPPQTSARRVPQTKLFSAAWFPVQDKRADPSWLSRRGEPFVRLPTDALIERESEPESALKSRVGPTCRRSSCCSATRHCFSALARTVVQASTSRIEFAGEYLINPRLERHARRP